MRFALLIAACALFVGCDKDNDYRDSRRKAPERPKCSCPEEPTFFMVNLEFKTHDGTMRSFPHKVTWDNNDGYYSSNPYDEKWDDIPQTMYATKAASGDDVEWFYSLREPERQSNGLVVIKQVDGPVKKVDFTGIVVTLLPCTAKELDDESKRRVLAAKEYVDHARDSCAFHKKKTGWRAKYGDSDEYYE